MTEQDHPPTEIESVELWRRAALLEAGYPEEEAYVLARCHDIDIHVAAELLANGCLLKTALKILL